MFEEKLTNVHETSVVVSNGPRLSIATARGSQYLAYVTPCLNQVGDLVQLWRMPELALFAPYRFVPARLLNRRAEEIHLFLYPSAVGQAIADGHLPVRVVKPG